VLWAAGGVAGGHSLYVKDKKLRYTFNWIGSEFQDVVATAPIAVGRHVCTAEFQAAGPNDDPKLPGTKGTLSLYVDDVKVGEGPMVTQPGYFCVTGDGAAAGRDSGSAVTPAYQSPFAFSGGTIEKVVVDLSGTPFVDHEAQVRGWFMKD
jgi:arylsulfatase